MKVECLVQTVPSLALSIICEVQLPEEHFTARCLCRTLNNSCNYDHVYYPILMEIKEANIDGTQDYKQELHRNTRSFCPQSCATARSIRRLPGSPDLDFSAFLPCFPSFVRSPFPVYFRLWIASSLDRSVLG
jgi:hypothetical protein